MIEKYSLNFYSSLSSIESSQCPESWFVISILLSPLMGVFWFSTIIESSSLVSTIKIYIIEISNIFHHNEIKIFIVPILVTLFISSCSMLIKGFIFPNISSNSTLHWISQSKGILLRSVKIKIILFVFSYIFNLF